MKRNWFWGRQDGEASIVLLGMMSVATAAFGPLGWKHGQLWEAYPLHLATMNMHVCRSVVTNVECHAWNSNFNQ